MKVRIVSGALALITAAVTATAVAPASEATTPALKQRLANVVVPAYCGMPQQRLHNGATARRFLPKQGAMELNGRYTAPPMLVHLRSKGTQLIAQWGCSEGGVAWPETIVLYDRQNKLIGYLKLGTLAPKYEHAQVDHWTVSGHTVKVRWSAYQGAGFDVKHHRQTLRLVGGRLQLH